MLTKLIVRNFKLFDEIEVELGQQVVFVGPNNAGKTTALQALALWDVGLKRWLEKSRAGDGRTKRAWATINRRDLIALPVPATNLLWRDLRTKTGTHEHSRTTTKDLLIQITVEGTHWSCGLEFRYVNPESFGCRPLRGQDGEPMKVPEEAKAVRIAYLPPMSGLAANETRLDPGAINVRLGEGRTAEVLRNLCLQILNGEDGKIRWQQLCDRIETLFGSRLNPPEYVPERGEITMTYRSPAEAHTRPPGSGRGRRKAHLDLSASGRGQQQVMLLLAHLIANPGSVLLIDEPDAHLEFIRQRQVYQLLSEASDETGSQIVAASHSEVLLNEAAERDVLIAFVGKPHRIDNRGSQVLKALKEIGFEHYLQAEKCGWVLYLEGATDLAILQALAKRLRHPAVQALEAPYVHYVANQPNKARQHFYGLREAKADLMGVAIYDRLETSPGEEDPQLTQLMWRQRELENYLCHPEVLLDFAEDAGGKEPNDLFAASWRENMRESIKEIEAALETLGDPSPWSGNIKATDAFLDRLFKRFHEKCGTGELLRKTHYHRLARFIPPEKIDPEVAEKLDAIVATANRAKDTTGAMT
ncbi:MAG: AAA family ATPase [Gammaproteobacteria bacterium]|nr:AAA family ATPase [Gammaproteobacteria bacterium]MDE0273772.1 AAA family ATPase [Gammaproteobacteria bacterium]